MGVFERWLSLWVAIVILAGTVLGNVIPGGFADYIQPETANDYLAGVILLGVAPQISLN